jgi:hypothetical protein
MEAEFDHSSVGSEIILTGISFGDGIIEIQFMEKRDQAEEAGLMKVLVIAKHNYERQVRSIMDEVEEMVDGGLLEIRNPEQSFDPRKRVAASAPGTPSEEAE